jgi:hypothetical protein
MEVLQDLSAATSAGRSESRKRFHARCLPGYGFDDTRAPALPRLQLTPRAALPYGRRMAMVMISGVQATRIIRPAP